MALDGTATGLYASVADFLNRKDLTAVVPDFVTLTEAQLNRRLRVRRMVATATATISAEYEALPTDFAGPLAVTFSDGRQLDSLDPSALAQRKWLHNSPVGEPRWFSVIGGQFQFLPAPNANFTALLTYYQRLPPLALNTTNWLLQTSPDAYLYGALTQAAPYLKDDTRIPVWGELFTSAMTDITNADRGESNGTRLTPTAGSVVTP